MKTPDKRGNRVLPGLVAAAAARASSGGGSNATRRAVRWAVLCIALVSVLILLPGQATAVTGTQPWVIVLCNFPDRPSPPPHDVAYYQDMFSDAGAGKGAAFDYWKQVSRGHVDITGTVVKGWYTLPVTSYQYDGLNRTHKLEQCGLAADADVDFSKYYGMVGIVNHPTQQDPKLTANLIVGIDASATTMKVTADNNWPAAPFPAYIDNGSPNNLEEVNVTAVNGDTWTITRGYENSPNGSVAHAPGDGIITEQTGADLFGTAPPAVTFDGHGLAGVIAAENIGLTQVLHEMGHGFGLNHSRALATANTDDYDYHDCYDLMSALSWSGSLVPCSSVYFFTGANFGEPPRSGPGLDAINLDREAWLLDSQRLYFDNSSCGAQTITLGALSNPLQGGLLEARIPAAVPIATKKGATTSDYYSAEFRDQSGWDQGIPAPAVQLHLHGQDDYSYWVDNAGPGGVLTAGLDFADAPHKAFVLVNRIGGINVPPHTAQVTLGSCVIATALTYAGPASGDYNDDVTLTADLKVDATSAPIPNWPVEFTLGTQGCSGVTDASGRASCTVTIQDAPGSYTAGVSFTGDSGLGQSVTSASFTIKRDESQVAYTGAPASDYHDPFTASGTLVDPDGGAPIEGRTIEFQLGSSLTDRCSATTDATGSASCSITPTQAAGDYTLTASFGGDTYYASSSDTSTTFKVTKEETTTTYTGPTVILKGASGTTLKAQLLEDGNAATPIAGRSLTLSLDSQSCTGTTNASGVASCTLTFSGSLGPQPIGASFAGDAYYQASSDTGKTATVFAFPSRGAFTLGDRTVASAGPTTKVTWWSDGWSSLNSLSGGTAPSAFKGFAETVKTLPASSPPTSCSGTWTTTGGNSPPPASGIPSYMGVLVTSSVKKPNNTISGNFVKIVVVRVNPGYATNPMSAGIGTIVATFCP